MLPPATSRNDSSLRWFLMLLLSAALLASAIPAPRATLEDEGSALAGAVDPATGDDTESGGVGPTLTTDGAEFAGGGGDESANGNGNGNGDGNGDGNGNENGNGNGNGPPTGTEDAPAGEETPGTEGTESGEVETGESTPPPTGGEGGSAPTTSATTNGYTLQGGGGGGSSSENNGKDKEEDEEEEEDDEDESGECSPHTQGYWKNHEESWPQAWLILGDENYTLAEADALMELPSSGDASLILVQQLIAAKLNILAGTEDAPVAGTILAADTLFATYTGDLPYGVPPSSTNGQLMVNYSAILDDYNNGHLTTECEGVPPQSTVTVEKVGPDGPIPLGQNLTFSITVTNSGPDPAEGVTLNDTLPNVGSGWSLGGPDAIECELVSLSLTCAFGTIQVFSQKSITLTTATTDASDCGPWSNTAHVSANQGGAQDASTAHAYVTCADVGVNKTATSGAAPPDVIGYTLTVTSYGPDNATNVTLTDALPPIGAWSEDSPYCGIANDTLSCSFGSLAPNETRTVTLSIATDLQDCGAHPNTAHVAADIDLYEENNADGATAELACDEAEVGVAKHARYDVIQKGGDIVFDVNVTSYGPSTAHNVTLLDHLPAMSGGWSLSGPDAGDCQIIGSNLTCDFGDLAPEETRSITLVGHTNVLDNECDCGYINNLVFVHADDDTDPSNNVGFASTLVICGEVPPESIITIEKSAESPVVSLGQDVVFQITVTNSGPDAATLVNVSDVLPPISGGWTLSGPDAGSCSLVGLGLQCYFGTLLPFESRTITVTGATGNADDCRLIDNTAFLLVDDEIVDYSQAFVFVGCGDVSIEKTAGSATIAPGDDATFTITVHSDGPGTAQNVTLDDALPPISGGWTIDASDPTCAIVNDSLHCDFGDVPEGEDRNVTVRASTALDATDCGDHPNTAFAGAQFEVDPSDNSAHASIHVYCSDVGVDKEPLSETADAGDEVGFTITVTSYGPEAATGVTLVDDLPSLAWTLLGPDAGDCTILNGTLLCDFGTLDPNDTASVTLIATSSAEDCGPWYNDALVGADVDTDSENNFDTARFYVRCSDVGVEKVPDKSPVYFGDPIGFTITVTSYGPDPAENVTLTDLLPANPGGWLVEGDAAESCNIENGTLTCDFGTLAPESAVSIHIVSTSCPDAICDCGWINNLVHVDTDADVDPQNDDAHASVYVVCSDIEVTKTAEDDEIQYGDQAVFHIAVTSLGPDPADGVTLTDTLPNVDGGFALSGPDAGACTLVGAALNCSFGTIAVNATRSITLTATPGVEDCRTLENTALGFALGDIDPTNNEDGAFIDVRCADVGVEKTALDDEIDVGDEYGFLIVVTSYGPSTATNVTLTDELPPGNWTLGGADAEACSIENGTLTCDFGDMPPEETASITISATSTTEDCGWIRNAAGVHADGDVNGQNDASGDSLYIRCADVGVEKLTQTPETLPGGLVSFTLIVTSHGPDTATNVTLTDELPPGLSWWTSDDNCSILNGTLTCGLGDLPSGATVYITVYAETGAKDCGTYDNTAYVAADLDTNQTNDSDSATVHVRCADVGIEKTADEEFINKGEVMGFTLLVTSYGPDAATNVTLFDQLPAVGGTWNLDGPDAGDCQIVSSNLTCSFGTMAQGETRTVHIWAQTSTGDECDCGWINNLVSVDADVDTNPFNNNEDAASVYVRCEEVGVEKEAQYIVPPRGTAQFNITVTSYGPDAAVNVTLTDTLPSPPTNWTLGGPDAGDCSLVGLSLSCSFGTMPMGATKTIWLTAETSRADCGLIGNTASVASDHDLDPENNASTAWILIDCSVPPESTITVEKSAKSEAVDLGENVTFTITLTNSGPDPAENVTLWDDLPSVTFPWEIVSSDPTCAIVGTNLTCFFGTVEVFGARSVTITADTGDADDCGLVENRVKVTANSGTSNDQSSASTYVRCADVSVEKTASDESVDAGSPVSFTIVVTNLGPDAAENVTLTDPLYPIAGGWTLGGPDAAACSITNGTLSCAFGTIAYPGSRTITLTGTPGAADCDGIGNTAYVDARVDTNGQNDQDGASFSVNCGDVTVDKDAFSWVAPGQNAVFTITVTSLGPGPAFNVTLDDTLPPTSGSWSLGGPDAADCTLVGDVLHCEFGDLAEGATRTVTLIGGTSREDCGATLENVAYVHSDVDLISENNWDSAFIHVTCSDVKVEKLARAATVMQGEDVIFDIVVTSLGPDAATNVTLVDILPGVGEIWLISGPDAADCWIDYDVDRLYCDFGTLAPNATAQITITRSAILVGECECAPACECGNVNNLVFVDADVNLDASNDFAWATTFVDCDKPVPPQSALSVEKVARDASVPFDGTVTFDITVSNGGPDAASNATLTDALPTPPTGWSVGGPDGGSCGIDNGTLSCSFGTIEALGTRTITIWAPASLDACGPVENTVHVQANGGLAQDQSAASVHVVCADVGVEKSTGYSYGVSGDEIEFTIVTTSYGPDDATNVTMTDPLPWTSNTWTIEYDPTGLCGISGYTLTCAYGTMPNGSQNTVIVSVFTYACDYAPDYLGPYDCIPECGWFENTAGVQADVDTDALNNNDTAAAYVTCPAVDRAAAPRRARLARGPRTT